MAMIGIKVPLDVSNSFKNIPCEGELTDTNEMHITIFHLGNDCDIANTSKIIHICHEYVKYKKPFLVGTCLRTSFDDNGDGYPIIMRILSPFLHEFRSGLKRIFDTFGVYYSTKYPKYEPHSTLSYCAVKLPDLEVSPIKWQVDTLSIWGGVYGNNYMDTHIKLGHGFIP